MAVMDDGVITEGDINRVRELLDTRLYGTTSKHINTLKKEGLVKTSQITMKGAQLIMRVFEKLVEEKHLRDENDKREN